MLQSIVNPLLLKTRFWVSSKGYSIDPLTKIPSKTGEGQPFALPLPPEILLNLIQKLWL